MALASVSMERAYGDRPFPARFIRSLAFDTPFMVHLPKRWEVEQGCWERSNDSGSTLADGDG